MRVFTHLLPLLIVIFIAQTSMAESLRVQTEELAIRVEQVVDGLQHPWSLCFLPDGSMLVTERPGRLRLVRQGQLVETPIEGLPRIVAQGQGGLHDVVLHPDFKDNQILYLAYVSDGQGGISTEVAKAHYENKRLSQLEVIYRALPKSSGGRHFGGRLVFDRQGRLYLTVGDRGQRERAQDPFDPAGSVIRLTDDGRAPGDNPFIASNTGAAEIFSYGHRNPQGMTLHPQTGDIWLVEHGPRGGDELNAVYAGNNYGWPVITYGREYIGGKIGEGTHKDGMEQPVHYWVPSISPSGMTFYTGSRLTPWQGDLFIGALSARTLVRLRIQGDKVVHEERMLEDRVGRVRDVRVGPDGAIYLLTDHRNGRILRIVPADS